MAMMALKWPLRRKRRPGVLLIDDYLPEASIGAGFPRAVHLLQSLASAGALVTLLPTEDPDGAAVVDGTDTSFEIAKGYGRAGIARLLDERRGQFGTIIVSRPPNMAAFRDAIASDPARLGSASVIYDAEALFAEREVLEAAVKGKPLPADAVHTRIKNEVALASGADRVVTVNEHTAQRFRDFGHPDVRVLGYSVARRPTPAAFGDRDGFLFVGPTYADATPNTDAVVWFADHVLPIVRRALGREVALTVVGRSVAPLMADRAGGRIVLVGPVADLADAFSRARVFVAPTRFSSGIPLKVYDAAAHGLPIVLTPLLAEQIGWTNEREVLVAATPEDFAAQCLRLHTDAVLWGRLRARALSRVAQDCSPLQFNRTVSEMLALRS
jgi:hypothetical protein